MSQLDFFPHMPRRLTHDEILANIAKHYGITAEQAYAEVTDADAEHLLDYTTGSTRAATSALMQRHGLN